GVATAPSASWEAIKRKEKKHRSAIGGVPRALPSLLRAQRVTEKASKVGFDWASAEGPLDKLQEELAELREAVAQRDAKAMNHEMGDLLFSLVNLARFVDVDAESALSATVDRFEQRFGVIEARLAKMGRSVEDADLDELETLWQAAKNEVG
ncbi:MAG: MazG nucleotide pyrophosphohydrolase domain-containing protein, partial [Myxococcota bacterium]